MTMLIQILNTLITLYIYALLLRFTMRAVDADFYNPITQGILKLTNPWANFFKFIPAYKKIDLGVFVSAIVLKFLFILIVFFIGITTSVGSDFSLGFSLNFVLTNLLMTLTQSLFIVVLTLLNLWFWILIASIILSWIILLTGNNASGILPLYYLLEQLSSFMLSPFRKILPNLGGLDISPIFALLTLQALEYFVRYSYTLIA